MPLWAASSFLSPPSLASGLSGSALSTKSTRSTQSPARQYVARLRGSKPPGPAACQGHDHFPGAHSPPCCPPSLRPLRLDLLPLPAFLSPPDVPSSQRGARRPRHPALPTRPPLLPPSASYTPAADRGERAPGGGRPRPAWNLVDGHGPTRLDPDYGSTSLGMENPVQRNSLLSWSPGPPTHLPARQPHTGTSSLGGQQHLETNICTAQRSSEPGLTCRPPPWWETGPAARRKVPRAENIGQREGCRSDEAGRADMAACRSPSVHP
ncbi:uncharacterized protein LOC125752896 isoform X2 [Canis lupus dingo]|uniref:uncharacterized protein LOC125752896 isoform X2 n=1 Tax=Canis lupus dingo TaxID=286419 RepID=UPI0020C23BD3|nr:uncharacterized protein LOC125752896 isoform X2 [Canis lupus dingo]